MLFFTSVETYLAVFGWTFFNILYYVLQGTSLWLITPTFYLLSIFTRAKSTTNLKPPVEVVFNQIIIYVITLVIVISLFLFPAWQLTGTTVGYIKRATLLDAENDGQQISIQEDQSSYRFSFGETSIAILDDDIRVPVGWTLIQNLLVASVETFIDTLPDFVDIAGARTIVRQSGGLPQSLIPDNLQDDSLLSMASLVNRCVDAGYNRLEQIRNVPNLSVFAKDTIQEILEDKSLFNGYLIYGVNNLCVFNEAGCPQYQDAILDEPIFLRPVTIDVSEQGMIPNEVLSGSGQSIHCGRLLENAHSSMISEINAQNPIGKQVIDAINANNINILPVIDADSFGGDSPIDINYLGAIALQELANIAESQVGVTSTTAQTNPLLKTLDNISRFASTTVADIQGLGAAGLLNIPLALGELGVFAYAETIRPATPIVKGLVYMLFVMSINIILFLTAYRFAALGGLLGFFVALHFVEGVWAISFIVENDFLQNDFGTSTSPFEGIYITAVDNNPIGYAASDNVASMLGRILYIYLPGALMLIFTAGGVLGAFAVEQAVSQGVNNRATNTASNNVKNTVDAPANTVKNVANTAITRKALSGKAKT